MNSLKWLQRNNSSTVHIQANYAFGIATSINENMPKILHTLHILVLFIFPLKGG